MSKDQLQWCIDASHAAGVDLELAQDLSELQTRCAREPVDAVVLSWSEPRDADAVAALAGSLPEMPIVVLTAGRAAGKAAREAALEAVRRGAQEALNGSRLPGDALAHAIRCAVERKRAECNPAGGGTLEESVNNRTVRIESALRESEHRFRALFDNAALGMDLSDAAPRARILQSNVALEEMLGYSRRQLVGKRIAEITHPGDRPRDRLLYRELISGNRASYQVEKRYLRCDGSVVWGQTSVSLIRDDAGLPMYTVGVVADITARKNAERTVRALEREIFDLPLEERRRLSQELHDGLGQELTGLSLLAKGIASDFAARGLPYVEVVQQFAAGTQRMIGRIRSISRGLVPVEIDSEGLMAALDELASATRRRTGIECRFRCERPVHVDDKYVAHHLYRIVQEAVANAVKHGDSSRICIIMNADGDRIEVSVKNNGRPFFIEECAPSGLGLEIMRYRAGLVGAVLCIEPEEAGEGTVVTCMLRKDENDDEECGGVR